MSMKFSLDLFQDTDIFSDALCKELIDIHFVMILVKNSLYLSTDSSYIKMCLILEWLGEKNCHNDREIEDLINSEEYSTIQSIIKREQITLNKFQIDRLALLYPIGIKSIK